MHNAPSVTYPVGRSRFALVLVLWTWSLGCAGIATWLMQSQQTRSQAALAAVLSVAAGVWAGLSWWRSASGRLSWNGSEWTWCPATGDVGSDVEICLQVSLDLQRCMLLRLERIAGADHRAATIWACLERASEPSRWNDLRRAVYSRARPKALPGAPDSHIAKP